MIMFIKLFAIALPVFLAIDMTWLVFIARGLYVQQIGTLLKAQPNWIAAGIFYVIFICGLVAFVIAPAVEKQSWQQAALMGAFFGLVTYATYDLTNLAVAKDWPVFITVVDLVWGTVLAASVSTITYAIAQKIA